MQENNDMESKCQSCGFRTAKKKPGSLIARLWRLHTRFCPGWKQYVKELESKGLEVPKK